MNGEIVQIALTVIGVLEDLTLPYHVGGSFASSVHGCPRQTRDLDLVIDLPASAVPLLVSRLEGAFYLDEERIRQAIRKGSSFNLVHLATGFKVDMFVARNGAFDRIELSRAAPQRLTEDSPRDVLVKSPEDTLLRKLEWYRLGGETSDRQWTDILGVIRTQGDRLDLGYLRHWAGTLEVDDLLDRALAS
jgi:hypothetical protein